MRKATFPILLIASIAFAVSARADERPEGTRCATWELKELVGEEAWSAPAEPSRGGPCAHTPVGPPANPQIGSSWDWYIWQLNGFPVATLESCTVRGMGDHCYVVVEDSQWNVNIDQTQVDTIVDHFENQSIGSFPSQGIWDLDTSHFGDPPDNLDNDPRVYILYYDFDVGSDGFFWGFDQQCDDVAQFHSNECDVVYMNCSDFDPAGSYLLAVLAHEFEHLIHYNHDPNEASWVDEGMAELAMWLYGNPDNISQFNGQPDRQLTSFNGNWYDYIKSYLFSLYFFEHYGGQAAVLDLVADPLNSISGFERTLDDFFYAESFADVFSDWVIANYLDDTSIYAGQYGYAGETLPPFNPFNTISSYPAGPLSTTVQNWASDYVRYLGASSPTMVFDGSDNNGYSVRAMLLDAVNPTEVFTIPLGPGQDGALELPQIGTTHDEVVVSYADIQNGGGTTYQYGAGGGALAVTSSSPPRELSLRALGPASAAPRLGMTIPDHLRSEPARLDVYDVTGRRVGVLLDGTAPASTGEVAWAADVGSGTYFARLRVGDRVASARVTVLR